LNQATGPAAPFPLLTYEDAHAGQIRLVVRRQLMPPWKAEPGFSHFENDRRLSDRERETITKWVDGGARRGDPSDLPPPPSFAEG
jgi:hypothetical protein